MWRANQPHLLSLSSTGSVFWSPGGPLHGHQSRLYVCQLGHRPEPCVRTLTLPCSALGPCVHACSRACGGRWDRSPGPSSLACGDGWFPLTWLLEVGGPQSLQSGPLPSSAGMLSLDHGPKPNPTPREETRSLGNPRPAQSFLPLLAEAVCQDHPRAKGEE